MLKRGAFKLEHMPTDYIISVHVGNILIQLQDRGYTAPEARRLIRTSLELIAASAQQYYNGEMQLDPRKSSTHMVVLCVCNLVAYFGFTNVASAFNVLFLGRLEAV